jgi:hypothetical protein
MSSQRQTISRYFFALIWLARMGHDRWAFLDPEVVAFIAVNSQCIHRKSRCMALATKETLKMLR